MIITHLKDGLGNQLFQYAVGRALAHKNNTELKLDITQVEAEKSSHHNYYRLDAFNIQENFATAQEIKNQRQVIERNNPCIFQPEILNLPDGVGLYGYWQSEKYFSDIADIILKEFTLKNPLGEVSNFWHEKILAAECAVSLHVRNGDYMTPFNRNFTGTISNKYYCECINQLKNSYPNLTLFVFSDELNWVKENLNFDVPTEFVEGCEHDFEEMHLMSLCKHNIITHSTFSWWSAWLNQNPDKKVLTPYPWGRSIFFGNSSILPESWIKIPVDYETHTHDKVPVFLSVVIYVEDGDKMLWFTLLSIFSQTFKDYDIIIVDASTDNSSNFYRQIAGNDNVTIIKTARSTEKIVAWNLGLECARSEYVLFFTGRDFILANAVQLLAVVWSNHFKRHFGTRNKNFIDTENYLNLGPEIICTTQRIEENPAGQLNVDGIADKKFSALVDAAFQNLNVATEIKLDAAQKLMLLATNQLNSLIGTKFFKLKFLRENKIRFDEKIGASAELMFIVDCFMRTENIVLVPQIFYGRLGRD